MKLKSYLPLIAVSGLLLVILSGCGKSGGETVAVVGDYEISSTELNDMFQMVRVPFATAQDEFDARNDMLDSLIVNRLLVNAAYTKDIDKLEDLNRVVLANKDKFLLDILYQKEVVEKAEVNEAEVKAFYDKSEYKIRASHILVETLDEANAIVEKIRAGESFDKLAFEESIDPSAKRNRGDLGYFLWGAMADEFQEAAFAMEVGEISPPVESKFGFHIIKLNDRLPNEQRKSFDAEKENYRQQLVGRRRNKLAEDYFNYIAEKYQVSTDSTTCNYLIQKREALYPPEILMNLPPGDFDPDQLDRNEKELVLATWDGGQITIAEYLEVAKQVPQNVKPPFNQYDSLSKVIFELKKLDILTYESLRTGLDKDPEYLRKVKLFKELNMADIMRSDSLPAPLPPDEGTIRAYYDEHPEEFSDPAKVHVYEILLSDEIQARKIADKVSDIEYFKSQAMDLTERPGKRASSGDLGYIERKWFPEIFDLAMKTDIGKVAGPVVVRGKYSVFYVVDKLHEELKDFFSVKPDIERILTENMKNDAFVQWVEDQKQSTNIEKYEDAIWSTINTDKYAVVDSTTN
ncbi:MAG: peptidylprolyl isomerase [bacterium]|nr:peptidylprolyl isomerase [bacterium]